MASYLDRDGEAGVYSGVGVSMSEDIWNAAGFDLNCIESWETPSAGSSSGGACIILCLRAFHLSIF